MDAERFHSLIEKYLSGKTTAEESALYEKSGMLQPNRRIASLDTLRGFDMLFWSAYLLLNYLILRLMYKKDIFIKV